jgi:hypothetical protein
MLWLDASMDHLVVSVLEGVGAHVPGEDRVVRTAWEAEPVSETDTADAGAEPPEHVWQHEAAETRCWRAS